jgi:two-component system, LytTR family, sensor kinase
MDEDRADGASDAGNGSTSKRGTFTGPRSSPLMRRASIAAVWTTVALFSVGQIYLAQTGLGEPPPLRPLLLLELPIWAFWALVTVPILMVARRFELSRAGAPLAIGVHTAAAVLVALGAVAFQMLWYQAFNPYPFSGSSVTTWFWQYFRRYFVFDFTLYWAVVGVYHAFSNYVLYRERELEASRARAQLTEARLSALKMQLRPHFLFNTLNSISALLERHPREARRVLAELAELLRASLRSEARHVIPLEEELDFLERYLGIERVRFGDRLDVEVEVDPAIRRAAVPSFLLQPLVENGIRHGILRGDGVGWLRISAARENGTLVLHVMDNGPGAASEPMREGIGLATTRRRLGELYGPDHTLALSDRREGGLDVRVEIPYRVLQTDR